MLLIVLLWLIFFVICIRQFFPNLCSNRYSLYYSKVFILKFVFNISKKKFHAALESNLTLFSKWKVNCEYEFYWITHPLPLTCNTASVKCQTSTKGYVFCEFFSTSLYAYFCNSVTFCIFLFYKHITLKWFMMVWMSGGVNLLFLLSPISFSSDILCFSL